MRRMSPYPSIPKVARIFERVTGENIGKRLAILLDGRVYSAPVIRDAIAGGKAMIEGRFTDQEAKDLAIVLRAGALPAPVEILEERIVGPSMGDDSIRMGIMACIVGGLLVIVFMMVYYKFSGMLANLAVVGNIVLLAGDNVSLSRNTDPARYRRYCAHHRHGRGCKCPGL